METGIVHMEEVALHTVFHEVGSALVRIKGY